MVSDLTNAQVDKLGERLREGDPTDADLQLLDNFRQSFAGDYDSTVAVLRDRLHLEPTGRSAKSTLSIADKL